MEKEDNKKGFNLDKSGEKPKFELNKGGSKEKFCLNKGGDKPKFDLDKGDETPKFNLGKEDDSPILNSSSKKEEKKISLEKEGESKKAKPIVIPNDANANDKTNSQPMGHPTQSTPTPQDTDGQDESESKSRSSKWFVVGAFLLALAVGGYWFFTKSNNGLSDEPTTQVADDAASANADSTKTAQADDSTKIVPQGSNDTIHGVQESKGQVEGTQSHKPSHIDGRDNRTEIKQNKPSSSVEMESTESVEQNESAIQIPSDSPETVAQQVINGKYGNNPQRRILLGKHYQEVQNVVNRMYRTGIVR
ncbi:hypothetical protein [Prevotella sp.]